MPLLQNIEIAGSRNVNKGLPEWALSAAVVIGMLVLEVATRLLLDPAVLAEVPPAFLPVVAVLAVSSKDGAQYLRRVVRDRYKVDDQVDDRELPR